MAQEGFPTTHQEQQYAVEPRVFNQDGSINIDYISGQFGLGIEEISQTVSFGSYTGTVAQMLADDKCPVKGMVATAYKEQGTAGVETTFKTLGTMDPRFSVEISATTRQREELKKKTRLRNIIANQGRL